MIEKAVLYRLPCRFHALGREPKFRFGSVRRPGERHGCLYLARNLKDFENLQYPQLLRVTGEITGSTEAQVEKR